MQVFVCHGANVPRVDGPCFSNTDRYVNCGNGTVTDSLTGLIWLQDKIAWGLPTGLPQTRRQRSCRVVSAV